MIRKHKSTKLNSTKYCYVSLIIQLNTSHLFTQPMITSRQNGPKINGNEGVLHTLHIPRTRVSPSDEVYCHT